MNETKGKPNMSIVNSFATKSGKSVDDVKKLWDKAEDIALKTKKESDPGYYQIVVGILKKMCGIKPPAKVPESYTRIDILLHENIGIEYLDEEEIAMVEAIGKSHD